MHQSFAMHTIAVPIIERLASGSTTNTTFAKFVNNYAARDTSRPALLRALTSYYDGSIRQYLSELSVSPGRLHLDSPGI